VKSYGRRVAVAIDQLFNTLLNGGKGGIGGGEGGGYSTSGAGGNGLVILLWTEGY